MIAVTVFATAAEAALAGYDATSYQWKIGTTWSFNIVDSYDPNRSSMPLYKQVRRTLWYRITQLVVLFLTINVIGIIAFQISVRPVAVAGEDHSKDGYGDDDDGDGSDGDGFDDIDTIVHHDVTTSKYNWSWMKTLYWAIQTTTTVGYGDLDMPFEMRWFQIFYTRHSVLYW